MIKFRSRLLFALITLIFVVLIGLVLLLGQLFKSYYLNSFSERLDKESSLVALTIEENGGLEMINNLKAQSISKTLNTRIAIVRANGTILYDSGAMEQSSYAQHAKLLKTIVDDSKVKDKGSKQVNGGFNIHYYWKSIYYEGEKQGVVVLSTKVAELQKAYRQIWWILSISLGAALIVIILLGYRITTRYTKPIESATSVAIELAKGNYRARTYEEHMDETGMLNMSINILARNLQEMVKSQEMQHDRLTTLIENMGSGLILIDNRGYVSMINRAYKEIFNVNTDNYLNKLYYDVIKHKEISNLIEEIFMVEQNIRKQMLIPLTIERKHFEVYGAPIIGTNDVWKGVLLVFHDISELKKLEQMRKDFVANVSHELKTPITSIKGFSETLLDGAMKDENTLEAFLKIILTESDRLQSLIQDLLDLSKMEQQGFTLNIQPLNIGELLQDVMTMLNRKADEKDVRLFLEMNTNEFHLLGDVYRLKQVFINLINNAIAYTGQGGKVCVTLRNQGDKLIIDIADTGVGIAKEEIPRIFERFYRVDKARSRNSGGTGLGLAIVKHLVEAHKGKISVDSIQGKGTTFTVELINSLKK